MNQGEKYKLWKWIEEVDQGNRTYESFFNTIKKEFG